jgi:hypothetical protein
MTENAKNQPQKILWKTPFHEIPLLTRFTYEGKQYLKVSKTHGQRPQDSSTIEIAPNTQVQVRVRWDHPLAKTQTPTTP